MAIITRSISAVTLPSSLMTAFPLALRHDVKCVEAYLQGDKLTHHGLSLVVQGESLNIPYRIYHSHSEALFAQLNETQAVIYSCILTRNHDGHVRERQIERLGSLSLPWVIPFIFQLCGEYVVEILNAVEAHVRSMNENAYRTFLLENPLFYQKTRDRMISYWDYRWLYKRKVDYVGYRLFDQFQEWLSAPIADGTKFRQP